MGGTDSGLYECLTWPARSGPGPVRKRRTALQSFHNWQGTAADGTEFKDTDRAPQFCCQGCSAVGVLFVVTNEVSAHIHATSGLHIYLPTYCMKDVVEADTSEGQSGSFADLLFRVPWMHAACR